MGCDAVLLEPHEDSGQVSNTPKVTHELPHNYREEKGKMFDFKLINHVQY